MAYPLRIPMLHTVYYKAPYLGPYSSPDKRSSESSWHCYDVPVCRWYYHVMCWRICGRGHNNAEQSSRRTRPTVQTELSGTTSQNVCGTILKRNHYSFKIFPQFWLAKSTRIIHHNQLLITKFGRILCLTMKCRQKCNPLQVNALLTEKTWGRGWVVLVVERKMANTSLVSRVELQLELGEIIAKNIAKTAIRQLGGRHLLFGKYLRSWTNVNVHYRRWT